MADGMGVSGELQEALNHRRDAPLHALPPHIMHACAARFDGIHHDHHADAFEIMLLGVLGCAFRRYVFVCCVPVGASPTIRMLRSAG
jgi:hypothetical protein